MEKQRLGPIPGAAIKWSARLKEIGSKPPSEKLMALLNRGESDKKSAHTKISKNKEVDL